MNNDSRSCQPVPIAVGLLALALVCAALIACGDGKSPAAPSLDVSSLSVTSPAGTIYIAATPQLQAVETLSNGTTRTVNATWSSDAPAVATVSPTGLVTAVSAGAATIAADANARRGTLPIRVYPNFNGSWSGVESTISCDDSGVFEGFCSDPEFFVQGDRFLHRSSYTQTDAAVQVKLELSETFSASGTGTVSANGELQLPTTRAHPEDPTVKVDIENLRLRSDVPARLTGSYVARFTAQGLAGSVLLGLQLEVVTRATAAAAQRSGGETSNGVVSRIDPLRRRVAARH